MLKNVEMVLRYFEGCNSGNLDDSKSTLAPDVVHYVVQKIHPPIRGANHLARYWRNLQTEVAHRSYPRKGATKW